MESVWQVQQQRTFRNSSSLATMPRQSGCLHVCREAWRVSVGVGGQALRGNAHQRVVPLMARQPSSAAERVD